MLKSNYHCTQIPKENKIVSYVILSCTLESVYTFFIALSIDNCYLNSRVFLLISTPHEQKFIYDKQQTLS